MENFEYSILLNDRDWAEFDLDSDECSLVPPALATAEDQVLSDPEEGEAEENRLIRVRASPLPAHEAAKRLPPGAPGTRPLAGDIWPGAEDETHLVSVNSGINSQAGDLLSPPDLAREQRLACASSESWQSPGGPAGLPAERGVAVGFNAMEGESDTGGRPLGPGCPSEVAAGYPFQEEYLQEQGLGHPSSEGPAPAGYMSRDATERMENPTEGKGNARLSLEPQLPKNETVSTEVSFPTSIESTAVSENAERSPDCPPEDPRVFQEVVAREAIPICQEKPSTLQEHSFSAGNAAGSSRPLSKSRGERPQEKASHGTEKSLDLRDEKGDEGTKDVSGRIVHERGQADYGRCSTCVEAARPFPAGQEENVDLSATQGTDPRCNKALDKHRKMLVLAETVEKRSGREPCRHFEMEVLVDKESYPVITGGERSELGAPSIPSGPTLESSFTDLTWPEMYDHFFCDNAKEEGGETRRDGCSAPCTAAELPDMYGPEMYEYFFNEMDIEKEGHRDNASGTFLGLDPRPTLQGGLEDTRPKVAADTVHISTPEVYEHFFANGAKDQRNWRGFLRRLTAAEAKKVGRALKSFLSRPVHHPRSQPTSHGALLRRSSQGSLVLLSPRLLDERPEIGGTAIMQPERPLALQPVLTQRDMCLGFVAFASWAVKTSDLQAPDAWKIVLLANFGTLSAIRYFRRQVVTERWHDA